MFGRPSIQDSLQPTLDAKPLQELVVELDELNQELSAGGGKTVFERKNLIQT